MIQAIELTFPVEVTGQYGVFAGLVDLLSPLPYVSVDDRAIIVTPGRPAGARPITVFRQADVSFPGVSLQPANVLSWNFENLQNGTQPGKGFDEVKLKQDDLGEYYELRIGSVSFFRLPMMQLVNRFRSHVTRIDHTGLNIPASRLSFQAWQQMIRDVAGEANIYAYPNERHWSFVIPATRAEYENDISAFIQQREPKFELVYDKFSPVPTIQLDLETDLAREEVERLLPSPYGISFPGLADYFRTVYVHHEWLGLNIRFDIRFKNTHPGNPWETSEWLVSDGGRIAL